MSRYPRHGAKGDAWKKMVQERRAKALELRTHGHTLREIGVDLGVSTATVYQDIQKALKAIPVPAANELIATQRQSVHNYLKALEPKVREGHVPSIMAALKCLEHEAKLSRIFEQSEAPNVAAGADFAATATLLLAQIAQNQGYKPPVVVDADDVPERSPGGVEALNPGENTPPTLG